MTSRTRRRVLVCVVTLAITVPMEVALLRAVAGTDAQETARVWAASLPPADLDAAARDIESYPFRYRKAIMRALPPAARSTVWRAHIAAYAAAHPELDETTRIVLAAASAAASPEALSSPTTASRENIRAVAEQLVSLIGRSEAEYVLYRLGPKDGTFASREPLSHKLAGFIRSVAVAIARDADCECNTDWGCDGFGVRCSDAVSCTVDEDWPACGWMWNEPCNGTCRGDIDS